MSCEHLICAHCNGPVVEARCPACREARARMHHHPSGFTPQILIATALILLMGLLIATHVIPALLARGDDPPEPPDVRPMAQIAILSGARPQTP